MLLIYEKNSLHMQVSAPIDVCTVSYTIVAIAYEPIIIHGTPRNSRSSCNDG